jgi:hypothetical protein
MLLLLQLQMLLCNYLLDGCCWCGNDLMHATSAGNNLIRQQCTSAIAIM